MQNGSGGIWSGSFRAFSPIAIFLGISVGRPGLEPGTYGLKVSRGRAVRSRKNSVPIPAVMNA
jgi:hypothetical protein